MDVALYQINILLLFIPIQRNGIVECVTPKKLDEFILRENTQENSSLVLIDSTGGTTSQTRTQRGDSLGRWQ